MQHNISDIFHQAFDLPPGDTIVIPCRDFKEMEQVRGAFYRELEKLRRLSPELSGLIAIHRRQKKGHYAVVISRRPDKLDIAFIVSKDGKVVELENRKAVEEEKERVEKLMAEDGYSPEQIKEYKRKAVDFFKPEREETK